MTNPTLLGAGGHAAAAQDYPSGNYYSNVGLGRCPMLTPPFTTESYVSQTIRVPGTISYLSWALEGAFGAPLTLTLNKRATGTALAVSFRATDSGWMTDSTDSISVSSGDTLDFVANVGSSVTSSSENFYCVSARFDATTGSAQMLTTVGASDQIIPSTTEAFFNFEGVLYAEIPTETDSQFDCLAAGTWQNMACYIENNSFSGSTTFKSRITGINGNMAISISGLTSGYFEDTTHTDAVTVGEKLCYGFVSSANGSSSLNFKLDWIGAHFLATDTALCMIGGSQDSPVTITSTGIKYSSLFGGGQIPPYAGETGGMPRATGLFPYALTASKFTNYLPASSGAATFTLLKNGSASGVAASSSLNQTGYIEDNSLTARFAIGDTTANKIDITTSNITWASAALLLQSGT